MELPRPTSHDSSRRSSGPASPSASGPPSDDPGSRANAHTARAVALAGQGRFREAIAEFREAARLIPDNAIARGNLGTTLARAGALEGDESQLAEAIEQQRTAVRLQPGTLGLRHGLAAVLATARRVPEALAVLDEALELDPGHATTRGLRSVALLTLGRFEEGWLDFDSRLDNPARRAQFIPGVRRWRGDPLAGTLLINALVEGQGDGIQGIRFAAEARRRVGSTLLLCPPSLARLLGRCRGIDRVVTTPTGLPAVEAQVAPLYLAAVFRPTPGTMKSDAYLSADPAAVERWRPVIEAMPGLKAGIVWQGNRQQSLDPCRSFRLAELETLARIPGVTLVSLQKGYGTEQRPTARFPVVDLGPRYAAGDWEETAAVASLLDLVIGCDSAVIHLAGALGRPTWVALSTAADWRWGLEGDTMPWYSTIRVFRQDRPHDWAGVFRRMADALSNIRASGANPLAIDGDRAGRAGAS
jgi:Flp pilus assembly protein TadD